MAPFDYSQSISTTGKSWNSSKAEIEGSDNDKENVEASETKYLGDWLIVAGKGSASWAQHVVKGNRSSVSSAVLTRSSFLTHTWA